MKSTSLFFLGLASISLALPNPLYRKSIGARQTTQQMTDTVLFLYTIQSFESARNALNPSHLDWSSDGCSDAPDYPLNWNFLPGCQRHDFGYRNYKAQGRFTTANKNKIDLNLKRDLDNQCAIVGGILELIACRAVSELYYEAVKEFGGMKKRAIRSAAAAQLKR
jgi:hypothetical protein